MRRGALASAALAAVAILAAGCQVGAKTKTGAGGDVSICQGIKLYNALSEPDATDKVAITAHLSDVSRVLGRIKTSSSYASIDGTTKKAPAAILADLAQVRSSYSAFGKQVSAASSAADLHAAVNAFSTDPGFAAADTAIELWMSSSCA